MKYSNSNSNSNNTSNFSIRNTTSLVVWCKIFVFVCIAVPAFCWFQGTWIDNRGRLLYLCEIGNQLQGAYQEIGLIQGTLESTHRSSGLFYIGTDTKTGVCTKRSFVWTLSQDTTRINGTFTCILNGSTKRGSWWATRYGSVAFPGYTACGVLSGNASLTTAGSWTGFNSHYEICYYNANGTTTPNIYRASFNINTKHFYEVGLIHEQGRILIGNWQQGHTNITGSSLVFLAYDNTLASFFWQLPLDDDDFLSLAPIVHTYQNHLFNTAPETTDAKCRQYLRELIPENRIIDVDSATLTKPPSILYTLIIVVVSVTLLVVP